MVRGAGGCVGIGLAGEITPARLGSTHRMYMARIIGHVEARIRSPGLEAHRLVLLQPLDFNEQPIRWSLIAMELTGAATGSLVTFEEGREAANPYDPPLPVDACVVAVVDHFQYQP